MTTAEDDRLEFKLPDVEFDDDVEVCPKCFGAGVVVEEEDGVRRGRVCDCQRGRAKENRLKGVGIPLRYRNCTLENFEMVGDPSVTDETVRRAYRLSHSFVDHYPAVEGGLLFMGRPGIGKTHLATGIIKKLVLEKGANAKWCDFSELLSEVKKRYAGNTFDEHTILNPLINSEILLLDDLGSMKIRDWTLDLLSQVINHRYVNKRILIATTNYVDEPAPTKEDITELEDRIGPRLRSRLNEMCKIVPMRGIDFRETKYQPGLHTDIS